MHEQVPWAGVIIVAVTMVGGAVLVHQVVRRASDGRLRRNHFAGIRTPSTMASESAWIAGHRAARRATDLGAGGMGLAGVIVLGLRDPWPFLITTLLGAVWVLFWVFVSARHAGKAARSASDIAETTTVPAHRNRHDQSR